MPSVPVPVPVDHRTTAAITSRGRRRVWDAVLAATEPVTIASLAQKLEVHPNTIRLHLGNLVEAGLVEGEPDPVRHPGRPAYRYRPRALGADTGSAAYRRLSLLLAGAVRSGMTARQAGRAAGAREAASFFGTDPVAAITSTLASQGFDPHVESGLNERHDIVLRVCPFAEVASHDPATICQLHLGLAEGTAEAIGGLEVLGMQIAPPDQAGCRLQLRTTPQPLKRELSPKTG
jgi:predicted ArsR family transcriptional regulator